MPDRGAFSIVIDSKDNNQRLDLFVATKIPECSRNYASSLIRDGIIKVDDSIKKPGYRVKVGEEIVGYIPSPEPISLKAEPLEIDIMYEDRDIIIVNKQPGMVVHPAPGNYSGTLVNALLYHCPDLKGISGELRPGIVHRLDKETSGSLVVAKNQNAHIKLSSQFKSREVSKIYLAIVHGAVKEDSGTVKLPIGRHPIDRKKMSTHSRNPRNAETVWSVRERLNGFTLLKLNIKTGRTHQIRVHCAAIHHPVVGDAVYCKRKLGKSLSSSKNVDQFIGSVKRQMLHAWQIGFTHPVTGEYMRFEAPIPDDMTALIMAQRAKGKEHGV